MASVDDFVLNICCNSKITECDGARNTEPAGFPSSTFWLFATLQEIPKDASYLLIQDELLRL